MAASVTVRWEFDHLPNLVSNLDIGTAIAIDTVLARIERDAKAGAPVKTGALRASGFRISPLYNDYGPNTARALQLNPKMIPVTNFGYALGAQQFMVGFSADYAVIVHDGGHGRAGRPFLMESVQRHYNEFVTVLGMLYNTLGTGGNVPAMAGAS